MKYVIKIIDDQTEKGILRKAVVDMRDSSWTLGIAFNNIKQATKINEKRMLRDSCCWKNNKLVNRDGVYSYRINNSTVNFKLDKTIKFDIGRITELLVHIGLLDKKFLKTDWHTNHLKNGMLKEIKIIEEGTTRTIEARVNPSSVEMKGLVNFDGYKTVVIQEGSNCGVIEKN